MAEFEGEKRLNRETSELEVKGKFKLSEEELDKADSIAAVSPDYAKAIAFLRRPDLASLPLGRHEIDGDNCWAMVQDVRLTPLADDSLVEAHREYVDIQMPLSGPETIGVLTMNADQLSRPFDTVKDAVLFKAKTAPRTLHPGEFAVFMPPYGAHAPGHSADGDRTIRKVVIKVRAQARLTD